MVNGPVLSCVMTRSLRISIGVLIVWRRCRVCFCTVRLAIAGPAA